MTTGAARSGGSQEPERILAAGLALLAAALSIGIGVEVFPYLSVNHDEAVYLQQAAMLLDGTLFLEPPVPEAFRPWFFVRAGDTFYPKYAPVPAAMFAMGELVGSARVALAFLAAAATWLTYAVVAEVFDCRRGVLAAAFVVASPLLLIQSAVFLPYLPTAVLNLLFALSYLRADRTGSRRWAAVAGAAIGLAFFARPYTAVLFATPFVLHALRTLRSPDRPRLLRHGVTAVLGTTGVVAALAYNAYLTGSPFVFPYEAFAPLDGLGFGRRALLGYSVEYTPGLALRTNAEVLWTLFARWVAAGPLGTALAALGLALFFVRIRRSPRPDDDRAMLLVGLLVSVAVGNLYFWGNLNVLGRLADPSDGLIAHLGPYYHLDLLLPVAAFAAHGAVEVGSRLRDAILDGLSGDSVRPVLLAALVLSAAVLGGASLATALDPLRDNREATATLATAYEPFEDRSLEDALVFLPTPQGDWLSHPFQALRNDPGYDGEVLYAIEERPFAVAEAFPDRALYRYTYRGRWAPTAGEPVTPALRRVRVVEGERLVLRASVGVPQGVERVSIRLASGGESAYYVGEPADSELPFRLVVGPDRSRLEGAVRPGGSGTVPVDDDVVVEALLEYPDGGAVNYRLRLPVETETNVRAMSPHLEACLEPLRCGGEATYVPEATHGDVFVEARLSAVGARQSSTGSA